MDHVTGVNILPSLETVDVEYLGDPPLLDEVTKFRIQTGEIPPQAAAVVRGAEMQISIRAEGITKRVVDPEYFGTSRQYVFGPYAFVVAVDKDDVDKILGSSAGYQFRRVGDPAAQIIRPAANFVEVSEVEGVSLHDIYP